MADPRRAPRRLSGAVIWLLAAEAALLVLAAWAAWPAPQRGWQPFTAPEVIQVEFPGGTGVTADVSASEGRITARQQPAMLIFR